MITLDDNETQLVYTLLDILDADGRLTPEQIKVFDKFYDAVFPDGTIDKWDGN